MGAMRLMTFLVVAFWAVTFGIAQAQTDCGDEVTGNVTLTSDLNCSSNVGLFVPSGETGGNGTVIDCAGHAIYSKISAIRVDGRPDGVEGVIIRNCTLATTGNGVSSTALWVRVADNITIANNSLRTSGRNASALRLDFVTNSTIDGNTAVVEGLDAAACRLINSSTNNTVRDNHCEAKNDFGEALRVEVGSDNNTFQRNSFHSLRDGPCVRLLYSDHNGFENSDCISGASSAGWQIWSSTDNSITGSVIKILGSGNFLENTPYLFQHGGLTTLPDETRAYVVESSLGTATFRRGINTGFAEVNLCRNGQPDGSLVKHQDWNAFIGFKIGFNALQYVGGRFFGTLGGNLNLLAEIFPFSKDSPPEILHLDFDSPPHGTMNGLALFSFGSSDLVATTAGGDLYLIDVAAGTATLLNRGEKGLTGIALDPVHDVHYVVSRFADEATLTSHLYTVDFDATDNEPVLAEIGDIGVPFVSDIAFLPHGTLLGNFGSLLKISTKDGRSQFFPGSFGFDPFEAPSEFNTLKDTVFVTLDGEERYHRTVNIPNEAVTVTSETVHRNSGAGPAGLWAFSTTEVIYTDVPSHGLNCEGAPGPR